MAHELEDDYFVSERESREDDFYFQIILDCDIIDHFIENYQPEAAINETNYISEEFLKEQIKISYELGHF